MPKNLPILGLGNDIIEIMRIREAMNEHEEHFLNRLFTEEEQEYCKEHRDSALRFAGRFAAKEAISKALGTGFGEEISWLDIEILPEKNHAPKVHFSEKVHDLVQNTQMLISISHCKEYAHAIALWIRN